MADFNAALLKILRWEGVYDNDPDDAGGETVFGITRKFEPEWPGWIEVDDLKKKGVPVSIWASDVTIKRAVEMYYSALWERFGLADFPDDLAQCFFGGTVNQGEGRVVRWFQGCLLALGLKVDIDGNFGPSTAAATQVALSGGHASMLMQGLRSKRVAAYFDTAAARENNRKYLAGWLNRLNDGA